MCGSKALSRHACALGISALLSSNGALAIAYLNPANGHSYSLTATAVDWQSAESEAVSLGGHLVAINDASEQQFIVDTFLVGENETRAFWIGFTDTASEGVWEWTSGDPATYTNWYDYPPYTEPNDGGSFCSEPCPEDYGTINWHYAFYGYTNEYVWANYPGIAAKGKWNDTPINSTPQAVLYQGIIELPAVPLPAGVWLFGGALTCLAALRRKL